MSERHAPIVTAIVSVIFLAIALLPDVAYGYYEYLRWIIFLASGYLVLQAASAEIPGWAIPFIASAILFNPLKKFYLGRDGWFIADLIAIPLFILGGVFISLAFKRMGK